MKAQKSIEVVTKFKKVNDITPLHFKISLDDESFNYVNESRVLTVTKESGGRNHDLMYNCETIINGELSFYNLKFEPSSCRWKLWRI